MQGQKHFNCLIICIYFLPYLLNDSQTIWSTINFSKPILCVTLIWSDWSDCSHFHYIFTVMPDEAVFECRAVFVQRHRRNSHFHRSKSGTLWQRMNLHFHSDQCEKTNRCAGNMLMSTWNGLGFVLKTTCFNYSESTLSLRDINFIHGALSDLKLCRMFSFT